MTGGITRVHRLAVVMTASCLVLVGCSALVSPPPELDTDFVPEVTVSALSDPDIGADGFTIQEHHAVRIRVYTCDGWSMGSGWVLSDHEVVTNQHVVDDAYKLEVSTYDGRDYPVLTAQVAPVADLALLTLEPVFDDWASWTVAQPDAGDPIYLIGYPEGNALTTSDGNYTGLSADTVGSTTELVMEFTALVKHGNSGSALYNADGVVIGTVYAGDEVSYGLAWSNEYLSRLLDGTDSWQPNTASC